MNHANADNLARDYLEDIRSLPDIADLPKPDESSILDGYLGRIQDRIQSEGIRSLYWVTGISTREISDSLCEVLGEIANIAEVTIPGDCCIVERPGESRYLEALAKFGFDTCRMVMHYSDSFIVVNESIVLDMTPVDGDGGRPEYSDDPTIASLYIGLFNMLKHSSTLEGAEFKLA